MKHSSHEFQVLIKPTGPVRNLACSYCDYPEKEQQFPVDHRFLMPDTLLEECIIQQISASTEETIHFTWRGGEPLMAGIDFFMKVVEYQSRYYPRNRLIVNRIQTNGTLLNDQWCRFLAAEEFSVGLCIDGPKELHDRYRNQQQGESTFEQSIRGYHLLNEFGIFPEILCVVHAGNVQYPADVYQFFKQIGATNITFLPLVERYASAASGVTERSVPAEAFGEFLCAVFEVWKSGDMGRVKVQIFEEALRTAGGQDHFNCIFKTTCGGVPVIEHNGDFYSCDCFVNDNHHIGNLMETPLSVMLHSQEQMAFGRAKLGTLPRYCLHCGVRDMCGGECPVNRFIRTPDGEEGLNYLCAGYKKFFSFCRPFLEELAVGLDKQAPEGFMKQS